MVQAGMVPDLVVGPAFAKRLDEDINRISDLVRVAKIPLQ